MKFTAFKTAKHQRFEYIPRYYDAVKEDIENRTALIESDLNYQKKGNIDPDRKMSIHFERRYTEKKSNKLLFLIIGTLFLVAYSIYKY